MSIEQKKITVSLPLSLLKRLDSKITKRKRSDFISHAIEEQLALIEQDIAINESVGIWSDKNHPDMKDEQAINGWLLNLRQGWS